MNYKNIVGFFGYGKLYEYIIDIIPNNESIIEIGSYLGRSTSYLIELANKSKKNISLISIDTFNGSKEHTKTNFYDEFSSNINNLDIKYPLVVLKGDSKDIIKFIPDNSIFCIMIDASHEYEDVKSDINMCIPKIKKGGILCGDDYDWPGVKRAVDELDFNVLVEPKTGDCVHDIYAGNYWYFSVDK